MKPYHLALNTYMYAADPPVTQCNPAQILISLTLLYNTII